MSYLEELEKRVEDEDDDEDGPRHHLAGDGIVLVTTSSPRHISPSYHRLVNKLPHVPPPLANHTTKLATNISFINSNLRRMHYHQYSTPSSFCN
ncbi:hypothetical protein QVD17_27279 [Tagetes erecta]|uniref:Uncharacterized protein n=1 Tax=Tagetes erecta TaxID=13708 RepID=A0AAD8NJ87_TARER|nr:hypothetical protein QVD17_27279 [Tagetes erecta]